MYAWLFDMLPLNNLVFEQKACERILTTLKLDLKYLDNSEKKMSLKHLTKALFGKEDGEVHNRKYYFH